MSKREGDEDSLAGVQRVKANFPGRVGTSSPRDFVT